MPWSPSDASRHKKGLTSAQAKVWAKVANAALNDGDDEGTAIRKANAAAGRVSKRAVKLSGKDQLGRPLWKAESVFEHPVAPFPNGFELRGKPKTRNIRLGDLRPTNQKLEAAKVNSMMADDTPEVIDVIESSKGPRIFDGHHRAAAAIMQGKDTIRARVWQPNIEAVSKMTRPTPPEIIAKSLKGNQRRDSDGKFASGGGGGNPRPDHPGRPGGKDDTGWSHARVEGKMTVSADRMRERHEEHQRDEHRRVPDPSDEALRRNIEGAKRGADKKRKKRPQRPKNLAQGDFNNPDFARQMRERGKR